MTSKLPEFKMTWLIKIGITYWKCQDESYNSFVQVLKLALDKHAPEKIVSIPSDRIVKESWMTTGLLVSSRTRDKLFTKQLDSR